VVIHDLHVVWVFTLPSETDAVLRVHADAVLTDAVTLKGFQPVIGRQPQVAEFAGTVELRQLAQRDTFDLRRQAMIRPAFPQPPGLATGESRNHRTTMSLLDKVSTPKDGPLVGVHAIGADRAERRQEFARRFWCNGTRAIG
jgi:hypothetical protein